MEVLFETRLDLGGFSGKIRAVQQQPRIHPEPVLTGDTAADGCGVSIYGTVLRDEGRFRMWYQAWPRSWNGHDVALVGYAESDNGVDWRKPALDLCEHGDEINNLCDLGFHSPSVFVDPSAPPTHRYRACGYTGPNTVGAPEGVETRGYYTAHSADGLHWIPDGTTPRWGSGDVVTSIAHPGRSGGLAAMKWNPRWSGFRRRAVWTADFRDGEWGEPVCALVPDEFDETLARTRGCSSADYYGMGMQPAGGGTVAFLWQFRHHLPRTAGNGPGVFGVVDVTLAYQDAPGGRWIHFPGRPAFIEAGCVPWAEGGIYTASCPVECGEEHRLYFTGAARTHGWYVDEHWKVNEELKNDLISNGFARIGYASWPKWRLFGFRSDPEGCFDIDLGTVDSPSELVLDYEVERGGSIHVELPGMEGYAPADALPFTGDSTAQVATWRDGSRFHRPDGGPVTARLHLDRATVWAFEVRSA